VPVEDEPYHRTVFKNDYVQAFRVTLQPGQVTGMHVHTHDDAPIVLSAATTAMRSRQARQPRSTPTCDRT
jgi:quercetin dioxygenase-like cupin family protein